jgi:hypothetical protein
MQPEERPPLLKGPPTPRDLEEMVHVLLGAYSELKEKVVRTDSMGSHLIIDVRASSADRMRELFRAVGTIEVRPVEGGETPV